MSPSCDCQGKGTGGSRGQRAEAGSGGHGKATGGVLGCCFPQLYCSTSLTSQPRGLQWQGRCHHLARTLSIPCSPLGRASVHPEVPISPGTSITPATLLMPIHLVSLQEPLWLGTSPTKLVAN